MSTSWAYARNLPSTQAEERSDAQVFFPLIVDENLNVSYFLDHINIIDEQNKRLRKLCDAGVKEFLVLNSKGRDSVEFGGSPEQLRNQLQEFMTGFVKDLDEILLPNQMADLKRLLAQRELIQRSNCEAFEMIDVARLELGMSESEVGSFAAASRKVRQKFHREKEAARQKAWSKIRPLMPPNACRSC